MTAYSFFSLYDQGFARVGCASNRIHLADPFSNVKEIVNVIQKLRSTGTALCVFPELSLCGYSIGDLLTSETLLGSVEEALLILADKTKSVAMLIVVGAPLRHEGHVYNCAVVLFKGRVLGIIPKSFLPNYSEFQESRHFSSGHGVKDAQLNLGGLPIPFGTDLLFKAEDVRGFCLAVEVCEDLWAPIPPSSFYAMAGASIIANLSASPAAIGKDKMREGLCQNQSAKCHSAYLYAACGGGESTTDLCWDGALSVCEDGELLTSGRSFERESHYVTIDIDLNGIEQSRLEHSTFKEQSSLFDPRRFRIVSFKLSPSKKDIGFHRTVSRYPFFQNSGMDGLAFTKEICSMQVAALRQRMEVCGAKKLIVGVSGGLDSAHALYIATLTAREMGFKAQDVQAYILPAYGTSKASHSQAHSLTQALGCYCKIIDIKPVCDEILKSLDHPYHQGKPVYDVTFENVQAGVRTDMLFRLANHHKGLVVGTGDMSELALGWCTYGVGDHMSHYNVNCGLPKTVIQEMFYWQACREDLAPNLRKAFEQIRKAVISPELIPANGVSVQDTQQTIGPYDLQDFILYYFLKYSFSPSRLAFLAYHTWGDKFHPSWPPSIEKENWHRYSLEDIKKWLGVFLKRFLALSQFKRSAMPNGPKIFADIALSPRSDLRLPADGNATIWLKELEGKVPSSRK